MDQLVPYYKLCIKLSETFHNHFKHIYAALRPLLHQSHKALDIELMHLKWAELVRVVSSQTLHYGTLVEGL